MNPKRKTNAIDRENNKWKQNQSSGGTSVAQKVSESPTHDEYCETPSLAPPHDSASPLNGRTASGEAPFGPPTSTRSVHPIMDLHEIKHCRQERLAVIQAKAPKLARLAEARDNLERQIVFRRFLGKDQALRAGQQRPDETVRMREQVAAELAARLRLAVPGKQSEPLYNAAGTALNVTSDERGVALGKTVEPLDALTRVAEKTIQSDYSCERAFGPCDRSTCAVSFSGRSGSHKNVIGCPSERDDVLPAPPPVGWSVHTLQVTAADPATEKPSDRRASTATAHDPRTRCVANASRRLRDKIGKRYSSDSMGDGPSARMQRSRARGHQQDHVRLCHADGSLFTEEEQVAFVLALSDTSGAPSSATAPAPAPSPIPTPPPVPQISLLVTFSARSSSTHTPAPPALSPTDAALADGGPERFDVASILSVEPDDGTIPEGTTGNVNTSEAPTLGEQPSPRTDDSPDVQVVPAPPRPPIELIVIADDHSDEDAASGPGNRNADVTYDFDAYASDESSDVHDEAAASSDVEAVGDVAAGSRSSAPTRPRPKRKKWHDHADQQYAAENWHIAVNRQFNEETRPKRRRLGDVNASGSTGSTRTPTTQSARAPTTAVVAPPQSTISIVVCGSESSDQLCSIPGCSRPQRMWRVDSFAFTGEPICCPTCKVSPTDATASSGEHSATCDAREVARSQRQSATPPTSTPPPTTPANATAATSAPAPPAPPPAQVHAVRSDVTRTGRPVLPPLSPLKSPHNSDDWLEHHQQWMLRIRQEREEVTGIREEDHCWEHPDFLHGWDHGPPRHCSSYQARREAERRRLLSVIDDHG